MPLIEDFTGLSIGGTKTGHRDYRIRFVSSTLSALRLAMNQSQHQHQHDRPRHHEHAQAARDETRTRHVIPDVPQTQIIEISDSESDEDSYVPPPTRTRRRITTPGETPSDASFPIDLTTSDDSDSPPPPRKRSIHQHKRPKTRHPLSDEPVGKVKLEAPNPAPQKAERLGDFPTHPKAQIAFPNRSRGDDRAVLSFRNAPQPIPRPDQSTKSAAEMLAELEKARAEHQAANRCPYYYDQKLEVTMYRGPGYEQFPIVLGSITGHKDICDQWDIDQGTRNRQDVSHKENLRHGSVIDAGTANTSRNIADEAQQDEQRCLEEVLQIFPQIQRKFVLEKYREKLSRVNDNYNAEILEFPTPGDIVAEIAELDSYPSEPKGKDREKEDKHQNDTHGETIVWRKDILKNSMYCKEAIILLAREFDHVPTHYIYKIVHETGAMFDSYLLLRDAEDEYYTRKPKPYNRSKRPRLELEKKYQTGRRDLREVHQYVSLVNELQAAKQHVAREALKASKQKQKEDDEASNLAIHQAEGSLIECQCCFDDGIPINRAVCCEGDDVHFFCFGCVAQLADTQIGLMKGEMRCMDGSGCKAVLSIEGVGQAVSIKIFDKLAFNQQQEEISAAGIEGLEQCPFCDFKAICDPVEVDLVFSCQNPDCGRVSCRKCNDDSHLPKSCAEAKNDKGLSARHLVEEARSEAMMRTCPKCKVKIVKELGCNKMRCTTCGCLMCYVCKVDISTGKENGYEHFNRSGAKCKLYDETGVDRHAAEANEAERAAIKKVREENEDVDEEKLRIDTKKDDEGKDKTKVRKNARPGRLPGVLHANYPRDAAELLNGPMFEVDAARDVDNLPHFRFGVQPLPPGLGLDLPGAPPHYQQHERMDNAILERILDRDRRERQREHQRLLQQTVQRREREMETVRQLAAAQRLPAGRYHRVNGAGGWNLGEVAMEPEMGALDQAVRGLEAGVRGLEQDLQGGYGVRGLEQNVHGDYGARGLNAGLGGAQDANQRHAVNVPGAGVGGFHDPMNPGFQFGGRTGSDVGEVVELGLID